MNRRRATTAPKTAGPSAKLLAPTGVATRDDRSVIVSRALAMTAVDEIVEVYVGWALEPVHVVSRFHTGATANWNSVGAMLRERVIAAIKPLTDAGWRLDGSPVATMRWDTTHESSGQHYDGCWVRMRSRSA